MSRFILVDGRSLYKSFLSLILGGLLWLGGFSISLGIQVQPSYADVLSPRQARQQIHKDLAGKNSVATYDEMKEIVEDPKVGIEQVYEKNEQKYFQKHPEETGLVEQAKELITDIKGTKEGTEEK
jgi:hypothetical protein